MPRFVIKLEEDKYIEWSTVVDAPVSYIISRQDAASAFGEDRVSRADKFNTSILPERHRCIEEVIGFNRAGDDESCLSISEIIEKYSAKEEG